MVIQLISSNLSAYAFTTSGSIIPNSHPLVYLMSKRLMNGMLILIATIASPSPCQFSITYLAIWSAIFMFMGLPSSYSCFATSIAWSSDGSVV
ncbi:hypothetical protein VNO77_33917 [Canavalia gladiata]|uniref:Uncharacterized protein n=1 Tax=Canavalia gladiata TaxID=3824 RepID=A0AAN9KFC1_CANGL